jgi:hypothetical protein
MKVNSCARRSLWSISQCACDDIKLQLQQSANFFNVKISDMIAFIWLQQSCLHAFNSTQSSAKQERWTIWSVVTLFMSGRNKLTSFLYMGQVHNGGRHRCQFIWHKTGWWRGELVDALISLIHADYLLWWLRVLSCLYQNDHSDQPAWAGHSLSEAILFLLNCILLWYLWLLFDASNHWNNNAQLICSDRFIKPTFLAMKTLKAACVW